MAEMFLSAAISALMEKATDFLIQEFSKGIGVEQDLRKLCRILPAVQKIIAQAEERSRMEPCVREWMRSLKTAVNEAEDAVDELKYEAIRKVVEAENRPDKKARLSQSLLGWSLFKNTVGSYFDGIKLKGILKKIKTIIDEMNKFGFLTFGQPVAVVDRPKSYSYVVESATIGRDDDLRKIVAMILDQNEMEGVAVLPIVGMGGLGKTTLAQLVYNNVMIQNHFNLKLWVCVSDEFNIAHIAKSIIDLAIQQDSQLPIDNMELICRKLQTKLTGKRYLLVLDDVWNENPHKWEQLKVMLECGSPGSVVIVTTRSKKVAWMMGTMSAYALEGLNIDNLWRIFRQRAFGMDVNECPDLVDIGKQLMEKCCGSPLVAKTLGGLMSYKHEEREWLDVLGSNSWESVVVENDILPVLNLSYLDLPSYMKQCFAFCAVFPKNFEFSRDTLIQLWMANNFIPLERNMEIEAKGIEIFNELAWRGFFQHEKKLNQEANLYKMHDSVYDLAKSIAGNEYATVLNLDRQSNLQNDILHLYAWCKKPADISYFLQRFSFNRTFCLLNFAETIFLPCYYNCEINFSSSNSFRVLSFHFFVIKKICSTLGILKHLRYLDLSDCLISTLPESLCTSYNLQTLILSRCYALELLPTGMRFMRSLRHLYLVGCDSLKCMPTGLGELRCLQTLTMYIVNPDCGIEELKELNLGGRLDLYDLSKIGNPTNARLSNMISKRNLNRLHLSWGREIVPDSIVSDPDADKEILQGLQPNGSLEILQISQYNGTQFAAWMYNSRVLRNLVELKLRWCKKSTTIPPLWQLPSLQRLSLYQLHSLKHICTRSPFSSGDGSQELQIFPKLKFLHMANLSSLVSWKENDPMEITTLAFPQLLDLIIRECPQLDALPSSPLLRVLEITGENNIPFATIETFRTTGVDCKLRN